MSGLLATLTTPEPGLSRDALWPGHCGSPVFLAKGCGETWCGDRGETGLKGVVYTGAKEKMGNLPPPWSFEAEMLAERPCQAISWAEC